MAGHLLTVPDRDAWGAPGGLPRLATLPNHREFVASDGARIPFVAQNAAAVVPGLPRVSTRALGEFLAAMRSRGLAPALLPVPEHGALAEHGLRLLRVGAEGIVALPGFSLRGGARKTVRQSASRLRRFGCSVDILPPPHAPALLQAVRRVSDAWLQGRGLPERRLGCGWFHEPYIASCRLAVVRDRENRILAFANLLDDHDPAEGTLDLIRHLPDAPAGAMDALFVRVAETYRREGRARFSLGFTPLAGLDPARPLERALLWLGRRGRRYYDAFGLAAFKSKFRPVWEPRYLAVRRRDFPAVAWALTENQAGPVFAAAWRGYLGRRVDILRLRRMDDARQFLAEYPVRPPVEQDNPNPLGQGVSLHPHQA